MNITGYSFNVTCPIDGGLLEPVTSGPEHPQKRIVLLDCTEPGCRAQYRMDITMVQTRMSRTKGTPRL